MKSTTVTISFESDKLNALKFYAAKKDADLQNELVGFLQKLYEKYVPVQTREYIESRIVPVSAVKPQMPIKTEKPPAT